MNKNFALVLSCAVSILGLASCNNKEADVLKPNDKTHTVVFQAQNPAASETKTALRLEVVPDWRETDVNDVHIFETETVGETVTTTEATHVTMEIVDEKNALFTAEFANADIIINPPKTTTKASSSTTYQYTAIMATREGDKYVVPTVQYPNEVACIDPNADMLVGRNETIFSSWIDEDQDLDLYFKRPVALARLAITNLEGEKVTMVKITTVNNITGYLTYDKVDFDNKKEQEFLSDDSDKVLTLLYPGEGKKRTTTFYAYFVCVPHGVQFSKIEVYTDKYVFTKEYSTPPTLTFTAGDFMNIALDMTPKEGNGVTKTGLGSQTLSFVDGDGQPVTSVEYDLVDGKDHFVAPTLVIGDDVVDPTKVEIKSSNEEVAIVTESVVSLVGVTGEATITASVPGDETHAAGSASYKITVTDTTAPTTVTFYKAEELVEGQEYIIVSGGKAMTLDGTTLGVTAVTDVDGVIETSATLALWTAAEHVEYYSGTSAAGHYTLKSGDNYLQRHSDGSTQTVAAGEVPDTKKYYVWEYDGTHLYHISSSSNTFYMGYDDDVWKFNYQTPYYTTTLYTTTKPLTKQEISFGEQPVTAKYDLNTKEWTVAVPELTGAQTDVTYSSNNDAIEVNATTGAITITDAAKKGDKATITATAAKTDEYTSATASYTVEIIDSTPVPTAVYNKVTSVDELEEDGQYLLVFEGLAGDTDGDGDPKVFNPVLSSDGNTFAKAKTSALDVNISNNTIESSDFEDCQFTLEQGYYLKANKAEKYIYPAGSSSYSMGAETTASQALTISISNEIAAIEINGKYLVWSTSSHYFSCNNAVSGQYSTGICLYKLDEGLTEQTLSFSGNEAVYDLGTSEWTTAVPTLSGAQTSPLVWESSDKTVATVDESGNITPVAKGTTTIKVTAPKSDTYKKGTASFTVTVTNSSAPVYTYTQITAKSQLVSGATYLIVSADANNYNGKDHGTVFAGDEAGTAAAVTANSGVISGDFTDYEFVISASGENYTLKGPNGYVTGNSGTSYSRYIQVSSSAVTMSLNMKADLSDALVDDAFYFYYTKSSGSSTSKEALYLNADGKYKIGGSGRKYGVYLYMKEGSEPEPPTTSTYTRIAGSADLVSGTYIIAEKTDTYLFNASGSNNGGYSTIASTTGITKSGTTITLTDDIAAAYEFVFTVDGENLTIKQVGGTHAGQYMFASASVNSTYIGFQATEKNFKINSQEGNLVYFGTQKGSNDYSEYLYKKSTDSFFKLGGSGSPTASDPKDAGVFLYKKNVTE